MLPQKLFQRNATSEVSWSHCEKNHQLRVLTRQLTRLIHMLYKLYCFKLATLLWKKFHVCIFRRYLTQKLKRVSKMNSISSPSLDFSRIVLCIKKQTNLWVGHFTTFSGHFLANYINIFHKIELQTIILMCLTCLNLIWIKSYDIKYIFFISCFLQCCKEKILKIYDS